MSTLARTIRLPQAVALYIGAVMGSGILVVPGMAAELAGPASLIAWGGMVLMVLPMALTMGWLASRHPHAGGVAHYARLAFGEKAGVYAGWLFLMAVVVGAPVTALTGAGYLTAALGLGEPQRIALAALILGFALYVNHRGMKLGGSVQIAIVSGIIAVLLLAVFGSIPHIEPRHFTPFVPHGWAAIGQAASILFWCFIGWEAVSHMSEEFVDPERDTIRGILLSSGIVGLLYFLTALATVGTGSYGGGESETALVGVIDRMFGHGGGMLAGMTGFLICTATVIAYSGAAARLAFSLAREGHAPRMLGKLSKHRTPLGGTLFLAVCFTLTLVLYATGAVSFTLLLLLPNASLILIYLAGCAAGVKLLKEHPWGSKMSLLSLIFTAAVLPFTGWALAYPMAVSAGVWIGWKLRKPAVRPSDDGERKKAFF